MEPGNGCLMDASDTGGGGAWGGFETRGVRLGCARNDSRSRSGNGSGALKGRGPGDIV
jgi:hypothetical protein